MKAIVYASVHHGNTKKLVDAISEKHEVELINAVEVKEKDLSQYEMVGFASGVYGGNLHQTIQDFAAANLGQKQKIFFIMTSAMNKDFSKGFLKKIQDKEPEVLGAFTCHGYNTFGPFKLIGGTSKGHPNQEDIENVLAFYERL